MARPKKAKNLRHTRHIMLRLTNTEYEIIAENAKAAREQVMICPMVIHPAMINEFIDKILVHEPQGKGADRTTEVEIYLNYVGQFQVPVEQHEPTEEERIAAEKEAERLRRKRESNRKYMKKIREKSKEFAEHERIAEEKSSDSNVCVEQNVTSKSNRQKVKGEKIA